MSQNAVTTEIRPLALFLDVDGTLAEIAQTPHDVRVPDSVRELVYSLCVRLDGALALVSGRRIADLDNLFAPYRFCAAGIHGYELRDPAGRMQKPLLSPQGFGVARSILTQLIERHPALLLEDKGVGLALHFRRAPQLHVLARTAMKSVADILGPGFTLRAGKCVYEVHPSDVNKATAIASLMAQTPFKGRIPVFIGDDLTDEDAFAFVNDTDGISVKVGTHSASAARYSVPSVSDALEWLKCIPPVVPPESACLCGWRRVEL
jgi:trehalose 6-phosphate phosphatase